jgi:hypothetical protein
MLRQQLTAVHLSLANTLSRVPQKNDDISQNEMFTYEILAFNCGISEIHEQGASLFKSIIKIYKFF